MFYQISSEENVSMRKFCELHGIPLSTFVEWKTAYDEFKGTGVLRMQKKRGRPNEVDEVGIHSLKVRLAEKIRAQHGPGKEEFRAMVFDEIVATYERKGIGTRATTCSNRTIKRIKAYHKR
jgi:transposase